MSENQKFAVGDKVVIISNLCPEETSVVKKITAKGFVRLEDGSLWHECGAEKTRSFNKHEFRRIEKVK
ncbi:MAG: hypothetical protein IJK26_09635 [Clostridia bacterium]|nr:hypothetical protein [Clostridia bacterium]